MCICWIWITKTMSSELRILWPAFSMCRLRIIPLYRVLVFDILNAESWLIIKGGHSPSSACPWQVSSGWKDHWIHWIVCLSMDVKHSWAHIILWCYLVIHIVGRFLLAYCRECIRHSNMPAACVLLETAREVCVQWSSIQLSDCVFLLDIQWYLG